MPIVSVVMPVYNTPVKYLSKAVDSILNQTLRDIEFIIINDSSDEETSCFLNIIDDQRVIVINNSSNLGITKSLNIGFSKATGKYIARMDADDVSREDRLEKQVFFMENHPNVVVCGTAYGVLRDDDEVGDNVKINRATIDNMELFKIRLLFENCGPAHPTAMFNSRILGESCIQYNEDYYYAQDYDMWVQCSQIGAIKIINEVLFYYRTHNDQISMAKYEKQCDCARKIRMAQLSKLIGTVTYKQVKMQDLYFKSEFLLNGEVEWYRLLQKMNNKNKVYDKMMFTQYIEEIIYKKRMNKYKDVRDNRYINPILAFLLFTPFRYKILRMKLLLKNIMI